MFEYNRIVCAVDGSKTSAHAFQKAVEIAKRNEAALLIAHVVDTRSFATVEAYDRVVAERADSYASDLLEDYEKQATSSGLNEVSTSITYGSPKLKIAKEVAPKFHADLIICGATGLNALERFFIGSVSEHITRYATCDVLVVRKQQDES
ncbi:universal stress protein UspA [Pontibacillus halophilus JSM 076056 = DSM 19796]|uniref:Universal stress protein n=1 Tax=Pontibacillus halophilus JSM 076056 = DSM 19796 TaxID=1385510 RepID=A0A0A5GQ35_9BACI|nr:universal stress protein [Pontibacillus halophilus]KGX93358.1 universal stress protein UspA [Pontibacillus halophilus JSM 076056 = DSM 19796]